LREILFRGKRVGSGEWIEGCLIQDNTQSRITTSIGRYNGEMCECRSYEVIPETVGQYTGLKDKNGKEIFEGDIVECRAGETWQGVREYDNIIEVTFGFTDEMWDLLECEEIEVIGNIYENKNLLEATK
jgi:uncharacterized phage protein (TIGR01671 family)